MSNTAEVPSLAQLADVAQPPPPPWTPQTVGWDVLAVLLAGVALWLASRALRRYWRNRYRRDALAELKRLEARWQRAEGAREEGAQVLVALPVLLKRCALAAWPRAQVAGLNGEDWARFIVAHAGHATHGAQALAPLVRELEYRDREALARVSAHDVEVLLEASRQWVQDHVSA
ncbi:DUF4381 domain-containing protein [Variovorax sp. LARHSF232]